MGVHLAVIGKLNALLAGGGHSNIQILASVLFPFVFKLLFAASGTGPLLPNSVASRLALSLRFFLFRLRRVFHRRYGRWERAMRLLRGRAAAPPRIRALAPSDETLAAISMLTL